jgi:quinol monooxygenase YgiN
LISGNSAREGGVFAAALLCGLALLPRAGAQAPGVASGDLALHAVAYVEARESASAVARAALAEYAEAIRKQDGAAGVDLFEQIGRPGHFAIVETWRAQSAFDERDAAVQQKLFAALEPVRTSGYDQRFYKTVSNAPERGVGAGDVVVVTHVDVAPNPAVAGMLARLAEASRDEQGNIRFDVLQHTMRANHFTVIERWRNQDALAAHAAAAHTRQYRDELQPLTGSPLDERVYVPIESRSAGRRGR